MLIYIKKQQYHQGYFFKNMATKEEIAQNEQFLLLSPRFQLYSIVVLSFKGSFHCLSGMFSKSSAAELLYVGKGYKYRPVHRTNVNID